MDTVDPLVLLAEGQANWLSVSQGDGLDWSVKSSATHISDPVWLWSLVMKLAELVCRRWMD